MENFETVNQTEEVVSPQETEVTREEVVSPQEGTSPQDMSSEEFDAYIKDIKNGERPQAEPPKTDKPEEKADEVKKEPFKSFETEADFQEFMNKTIGNRLKGTRQKYGGLEEALKRVYPNDTPEDAISKIVADMERQAAEESGKSVEEIREESQLRADAEAYRAIKKQEKDREEQIQNIQESWSKDEEQIKAIIPDFDFKKAMENETFKSAVLDEGLSLSAAYIKALKNQPPERKRERVFEVGMGAERGAEMGGVDPMRMNEKDFYNYIQKIKEG